MSVYNSLVQFIKSLELKQLECFAFVVRAIARPDVVPAVGQDLVGAWPTLHTHCWEAADSLSGGFRQTQWPRCAGIQLGQLILTGL